jgi:hypothetical protein
MASTYNKITNRLMVASAIALGSAIAFAKIPSSNAAVNNPSVSTDLSAPGSLNFAKISTIFTARIKSIQCTPGGEKFVKTNPPIIDFLSLNTTPPHRQLPQISCGLNRATANTANTTILSVNQPHQSIFKGWLNANASINRSVLVQSSVFASSYSQFSLQSTVPQNIRITGKYNDARTAYFQNANPANFSATDTTIKYSIQALPQQNQRQLSSLRTGFLFRTQSHLDGVFNWNDDGIDFTDVKNGTFSIEWGDVVGRRGSLFLELEKGCVVNSVDTEDFEGWLPQIGFCSPIILSNNLPNFGFDFKYDFGSFDHPVKFGLGIDTKSAAAPEPITIIGTFASLGFGFFFKRKYGKRVK